MRVPNVSGQANPARDDDRGPPVVDDVPARLPVAARGPLELEPAARGPAGR